MDLVQALILKRVAYQHGCVYTICSEHQWQNRGCKYCLNTEAISHIVLDNFAKTAEK